MAIQGRTQLKTYFETGDRPTQQQFYNLIESMFNYADDSLPSGGGSEITNGTDITNLRTQSNWSTQYGGDYSGPAITANENDYCIADNIGDHTSTYMFVRKKVATVMSWKRIPIEIK